MYLPINYVIILYHMIKSICFSENKDFIEEFNLGHEFLGDLATSVIMS